jgi:hypothetical protein
VGINTAVLSMYADQAIKPTLGKAALRNMMIADGKLEFVYDDAWNSYWDSNKRKLLRLFRPQKGSGKWEVATWISGNNGPGNPQDALKAGLKKSGIDPKKFYASIDAKSSPNSMFLKGSASDAIKHAFKSEVKGNIQNSKALSKIQSLAAEIKS